MCDEHAREKPAKRNDGLAAEPTTMPAEDHDPVTPPLTGMIGMHIDQSAENAPSGSPSADVDRSLAESK